MTGMGIFQSYRFRYRCQFPSAAGRFSDSTSLVTIANRINVQYGDVKGKILLQAAKNAKIKAEAELVLKNTPLLKKLKIKKILAPTLGETP